MTLLRLSLTLLLALSTAVSLAGCGNVISTEINGATGVSRGQAGVPELHFAVCSGSVGIVYLYGPHVGEDSQSQEPVGIWRAKEPLVSDVPLSLADPGPAWTVERDPGPLDDTVSYSAFGQSVTADEEISQVDFRPDRIRRALPNLVLYRRTHRVDVDDFQAEVCP